MLHDRAQVLQLTQQPWLPPVWTQDSVRAGQLHAQAEQAIHVCSPESVSLAGALAARTGVPGAHLIPPYWKYFVHLLAA